MPSLLKEYQFNLHSETKVRSIRKALATALCQTAETAEYMTGRTINDLPEYFLSVKTAEFILEHFDSFTFSMEDTISELVKAIDIPDGDKYLTRKTGNVDLTLRNRKTHKIKHLVEFKRGFKEEHHLKDIERLAEFCLCSPAGHKVETNFMVMVAPVTAEEMNKRSKQIEKYLSQSFNKLIGVVVEYIDLSHYLSTRATKREEHPLYGAVYELKYMA